MGRLIILALGCAAAAALVAGLVARFLGRLVHLGWLALLAATVWAVVQWQGAQGGMADLALVVVGLFMLLPAGLGWALGTLLGLRWRARTRA